ncbi:MAG: serine/threonine-protein kinase [Myxococcota bacterium]
MEGKRDLAPGSVYGDYEVDRLMFEGPQVSVYLAKHTKRRTWHELKVLWVTDARRRIRVEQEAVFRDELRHPNIVAATEVLDIDDVQALVSEFVEGPTLAEWLRSNSTPPIQQTLALFRGLVLGVQHAHAHQVVHRDLKPSNIRLQPSSDGEYTPRICDFGIAKAIGAEFNRFGGLTTINTALGTAGYAAPEQVRDASSVDHRADIYALGCILYELVCGVAPFAGLSAFDTLAAQHSDRFTRPEKLAPGLPAPLYELIGKLVVALPDQRLQSTDEMLARVDAVLAKFNSPIEVGIEMVTMRSTDGLGMVVALVAVPMMALLAGSIVVFAF